MKSPKKAIDTKTTKAPKTKAAKPSAKTETNPVKSKIADDEDEFELRKNLEERQAEIQCIVSNADIPFGGSQRPALWDYADGVDTLAFLQSL